MPSKKHHNVLFLIVNVMIVVVMGDLPGKNCQDFNSWKEFHRQTY